MKRFSQILILFLVIALTGAGCSWFGGDGKILPAGPRPANFDGLNPDEAAKKINFVPGSQIEIRQTYLGLGAQLAEQLSDGDKTNVRIITIERFAPMNYANLSWQLSQNVETEESKNARADYEEQLANLAEDQNPPEEPELITERQTVVGSLDEIDLKNSHKLLLPAYWPTGEASVNGLSAIWVSDDVYRELTRTKVSTIYFGILDSALFGAMSSAKEFADSINALRGETAKVADKVDVDLVNADEPSNWSLMVNGEEVEVEVIKARNWFGEIVVLDNPQNPLILKMTFNPVSAGALDLVSGTTFLKALLGYEVTQLNGVE